MCLIKYLVAATLVVTKCQVASVKLILANVIHNGYNRQEVQYAMYVKQTW